MPGLLHTLLIDGKPLKWVTASQTCYPPFVVSPRVLFGPLLFTQIYVSLTTPDTCRSLNQLIDCLQDVSLWMKNNKLKLNADQTEFLIIGTSTQRAKLHGFSRHIS